MTTFDRYLLSRFLYVNFVLLVAVLGLFAVIDGFVNLDEFQANALDPLTRQLNGLLLVQRMATHYFYQSLSIVDLAGPSVMVLAAMITLILMLRQGEIHPVLAAGVPTYRVTITLLWGTLAMNMLLILNQEFALPVIAPHLVGDHGDAANDAQLVKEQYDPVWRVLVRGDSLIPGKRRLHHPEFHLPAPALVDDFVTLKGEYATYFPPGRNHSGGWLLVRPDPPGQQLPLTPQGRKFLSVDPRGENLFLRLTVTFDQLNARSSSLRMIPSREIARRLQQPMGSQLVHRAGLIHLHARLTRPLLTIIGLYIVIPLICRRDRISPLQQVANIAMCMATVGAIYSVSIGMQFLGRSGLMSPEQSVWVPLILGATLTGWLSGYVRT